MSHVGFVIPLSLISKGLGAR